MTEESTLTEDGLAKRIADFAASCAANQKALADLALIANPNMVAMLAEAALSDRGRWLRLLCYGKHGCH